MKTWIILMGLMATIANAGNCSVSTGIPNAQYMSGFCGWTFASGLAAPRGMEVLPNGDILVVTRGAGSLTQLWEEADGSTGSTVIYSGNLGLNHAVRYYNGSIYASSDTTVYRWTWMTPRAALGNPTQVLTGMPAAGNHNTRTLEFKGPYMFVNIGSQNNIDTDSTRARIIRVDITGTLPRSYGTDTVVYADGTRNECGLRLDTQGRLWGVENGIDNIGNGEARSDLGNVAKFNPAEEVNIFTDENMGRFYGYPYCWSEGLTPDGLLTFSSASGQEGTQWSTYNTQYNDSWCRNTANVIPPVYTFQAHHAPLDIIFVSNSQLESNLNYSDFALISSHGTNRSLLVLPLTQAGNPVSDWNQIQYLVHGPYDALWNVQPVAMAYAPCASYGMCIYFSDDNTGSIFVVAAINGSFASSSSTPSSSSTSTPTSTSTSTPASTSTQDSTQDSTSNQITRSSEGASSNSIENNQNSGSSLIGISVLTFIVALLYV